MFECFHERLKQLGRNDSANLVVFAFSVNLVAVNSCFLDVWENVCENCGKLFIIGEM